MSWNAPENRIREKELMKLYDTDSVKAQEIRTQWHITFDPTHNEAVYVNPVARAELYKALIATQKYQPKTKQDKLREGS